MARYGGDWGEMLVSVGPVAAGVFGALVEEGEERAYHGGHQAHRGALARCVGDDLAPAVVAFTSPSPAEALAPQPDALLFQVGQGLRGTLTNGLTFPLAHGGEHMQNQSPGGRAGIDRVGHRHGNHTRER